MKKALSLVLVLSMLLGCFAVTSYAAEPVENVDYTENDSISIGNSNPTNYEPPKKYTLINANEEVTEAMPGEDVSYVLNIQNVNEYDQLSITYASTTNVTLDDYVPDIFEYSDENILLTLDFTVSEEAYYDEFLFDYRNIIFEEIRMDITAYVDGEIVEAKEEVIYIFPTSVGVYITALEKNYAYNCYLNIQLEKGSISEENYKKGIKSIATLPITVDGELTEEKLQEELETINNKPLILKKYSGIVGVMKNVVGEKTVKVISPSIVGTNTVLEPISSVQSIEPRASIGSAANNITITRTITATNSGANLTVYGNVYWRDIAGVQHPLRQAYVAIMDENVLNDDTCGVGYTDNNGYYSITVENNISWLENGLDVYVEVRCIGESFTVKPNSVISQFSNYYYVCSETTSNVKSSKTLQTSTVSATDETKAFQIHQALIAGYIYFSDMDHTALNAASVYYPVDDKTVSYYEYSEAALNIRPEDAHSWDIVLHELGHHTEDQLGIIESYNVERHIIGEDITVTNNNVGKNVAIYAAWGEGWADFFAIAAQQYYNNTKGISISDIPTANNTSYEHVNISGTTYNITGTGKDLMTITAQGESDEATIASVLLNILSNSDISYNDATLWTLIDNSKCKTLNSFMAAFYSQASMLEVSLIGGILEACHTAAMPVLKSSLIYSETSVPTFTWYPAKSTDANGAPAYPLSSKFTVWDGDFNIVFQSQVGASVNAQASFTPTQAQWNNIVSSATSGIFYWGLVDSQNSSPVTGPYYSSLQRGVFASRVPTVSNLDTAYVGSISQGMQYWYKFTPTSSGSYTIYTIGPSNTKGDVYTGTYLHDNYKNHMVDDDSGDGVNFSITMNLTANQTVYIRVRGGSRTATGLYHLYVHKI